MVERNRLEPREDGSLAARPTGERDTLDCGLVLRSIGYKGIAIPEVPFDERRGTIPNVAGRVVDGEHHVTGEYVTGWIRRGPSGVIGTNKKDGQEAASSLLEDAEAGLLNEPANEATSPTCSPSAASSPSAGKAGSESTRTSRSSAPARAPA